MLITLTYSMSNISMYAPVQAQLYIKSFMLAFNQSIVYAVIIQINLCMRKKKKINKLKINDYNLHFTNLWHLNTCSWCSLELRHKLLDPSINIHGPPSLLCCFTTIYIINIISAAIHEYWIQIILLFKLNRERKKKHATWLINAHQCFTHDTLKCNVIPLFIFHV